MKNPTYCDDFLILDDYLDYPEILEPYKVLKIPIDASHKETKAAFRKNLSNTNRASTCLAYEMICSKENFIQLSEEPKYKVKNLDQFYCVHVGYLEGLKNIIDNNPPLIHKKDHMGRSLLYLAARNGYMNICYYLLQKGANINETQGSGITPLHGASFYGNDLVVQLLLQYGADTTVKNKFSNYAFEECKNQSIKKNIKNFTDDVINILFKKIQNNKLSNGMRLLKKQGKIIGKKILRNIQNNHNNWILCWHGTHYNALYSIMENSLIAAGSKLKNGLELEPKDNHISRYKPVDEIEDWAKAIFVSPSILYAFHACYSERIYSEGERWGILIETKVRPNSYFARGSTIRRYKMSENEPNDVEYRIPSAKDVEVLSIVFAKCSYIDNNNNYLNLSSIFNNF